MEDMIARAARGDEKAFEILVNDTQKMVYNICLKMAENPEDALDLSQETYLKAWRALPQYKGESKFSTWLCRIASNTCLDFIRRQNRKKEPDTVSLEEELPPDRQIADYSRDPGCLLEVSAEKEMVREAFFRLPEEERLLLSLRAFEEMSYEDIGIVLNLKPGTVKSKIFRAREKIRRNLSGKISSDIMKGGLR